LREDDSIAIATLHLDGVLVEKIDTAKNPYRWLSRRLGTQLSVRVTAEPREALVLVEVEVYGKIQG
jgi:hypothetical protein